MRLNPDPNLSLIDNLAASRAQQDSLMQQLSSSRRVNKLSDDPAAAAADYQLQIRSSETARFLQNLTDIRSQFSLADSTLSSSVNVLTRAVTLGTQGATGTLSQTDRDAIAQEVSGLRDELLGLSNVTYNGKYLFAGTNNGSPPFAAGNSGAITYQGNQSVISVETGDGQTLPVNMAGDKLFDASGASAFQALDALETALKNNGDIAGANTQLQKALSNLSAQRVFYGNGMNRIDSTTTALQSEQTTLAKTQDSLVGADLASVISQLNLLQTSYSALLQATERQGQNSLLDYLR